MRTRWPDIFLPPNLLSLSRIAVTPFVAYFLAQNDASGTAWCVALTALAAATDGLDGYIARRYHMTSQLGLFLDPLADKLFAAVMLIELVLFRGFPNWLAALIVGRDLVILTLGLMVFQKRHLATPSTITGQYTFASILILIGFYIIRFHFGSWLIGLISVVLIALSMAIYGLRLTRIMRGEPIKPFQDKAGYRAIRVTITALVIVICMIALIHEKL